MAASRDLAAAPVQPTVNLFSKHLAKLHYSEFGEIVRQLGFDGVDLTVRPGGHVLPEKVLVDLNRSIESIREAGLEVPMITTGLTSPSDPNAVNILGIAGQMQVTYFKPGYWRYTGVTNVEARLAEVRRDLHGLVSIGRHFGIQCGFHNHSGDYVGTAVWDIRSLIADMEPRWVGYYFDPSHATAEGGVGAWEVSLRLALPRLKMVALKDFYWAKVEGKWRTQMCPMGDGMVDWPKVFSILASARFSGPLSLHIEYNPPDELDAFVKDLAFVRKELAKAYNKEGAVTPPTTQLIRR